MLRLVALAIIALPVIAHAQEGTRLNVDAGSSLAWWQIDPNYGHLWATTCPADPNWQAGEGRSPGAKVDFKTRKEHVASARKSGVKDIPMYPRLAVHAVCRHAVRGGLLTMDTVNWSRTRGEVIILPDSLTTGLDMRDAYATKEVFETRKFRQIRFVLDSLSAVQPGDTIRAVAHGTIQLHGVHRSLSGPVKAWRVPSGLRVQSHFEIPAEDLSDVYKMSKMALSMGTVLGRWDKVHMGVDLILKR